MPQFHCFQFLYHTQTVFFPYDLTDPLILQPFLTAGISHFFSAAVRTSSGNCGCREHIPAVFTKTDLHDFSPVRTKIYALLHANNKGRPLLFQSISCSARAPQHVQKESARSSIFPINRLSGIKGRQMASPSFFISASLMARRLTFTSRVDAIDTMSSPA